MNTSDDVEGYPGLGRLAYFLGLLLVLVVHSMLTAGRMPYDKPTPFPEILAMGLVIILSVFRMQNIGKKSMAGASCPCSTDWLLFCNPARPCLSDGLPR